MPEIEDFRNWIRSLMGMADYDPEEIPVSGTRSGSSPFEEEYIPGQKISPQEAARGPSFWLVIGVPKKDFSERVEVHPDYPMLVPKKGQGFFYGVAKDDTELQRLTVPPVPGPEEFSEWAVDLRRKYIFLAYKISLPGAFSWRELLEYAAQRGMLLKTG